VTALQLALDMAVATTTPIGHGHVYAPEHYIDAWITVTDVRDWSDDALAALKSYLAAIAAKRGAVGQPDQGDGYEGRGG